MKIISEERLGDYLLLTVDGAIPSFYSYVIIGENRFDPVPSHNLNNFVAIESPTSQVGKDIDFVLDAVIRDG